MIPLYLSVLSFTLLLVFVFFYTRQFIRLIQRLTDVICDLKAFSMGKPSPQSLSSGIPLRATLPPEIDEDFGEVERPPEEPLEEDLESEKEEPIE